MLKRLLEIKKRREELRSSVNTLSGEELDKALQEVEALKNEETDINKRMQAQDALEVEKRGTAVVTPAREITKEQVKEFTADNVIEAPEYRSAFLKRLQGKTLTDIEKRALTTATDSVGDVIPTSTMNKIIEKIEQNGVIFPYVTALAIPSNVKIPVEGDTADVTWVDEGTESTSSDDTVTSVSLGAYELIKTIEITAHVEAMSIDAFESFIVALLARKARKAIDYAIINGDGTSQGQGILTALADEITTTDGTSWDYDDIINLKRGLSSGYYQNARFIMSTNTLAEIEKIKDSNKRPIFKAESDNNVPTLSGKPVLIYDNMPDGTIIFGDLDYYYFNTVKAFEIAKDTSVGFKSGKTCYRALALCDGKPALNEAFAVKQLAEE